jgi:hypothetical protein
MKGHRRAPTVADNRDAAKTRRAERVKELGLSERYKRKPPHTARGDRKPLKEPAAEPEEKPRDPATDPRLRNLKKKKKCHGGP